MKKIGVKRLLTPEQAVFCFSNFFYDMESNIGDRKKIRLGVCPKCGAESVIITGIPERGISKDEVEETICTNIYCGIVISTNVGKCCKTI